MQCDSAKIRFSDAPDADSRWRNHLASCASCRAEVDHAAQLRQALPEVETPAAVAVRLRQLTAATATRSLECVETLELLEPYREGLLPTEETFLVEDHLLWCTSCAEALEVADGLTTVLRALPQMTPPDSIAERLVQARLPWWQRLWTAPAPSWSLRRLLQVIGAVAAAALLFAVMMNLPEKGKPIASNPMKDTTPATNTVPPQDDPAKAIPAPKTVPGQIAVTLPTVSAKTGTTATVTEPTRRIRPETFAYALPIDPMVVPVAKALMPLAGIRPDAMIQPRDGAPKDRPVEANVGNDDPMPKMQLSTPEKNVSATARDKMLEMNNEYALARSEEELGSVPDTVKSTTLLRPEAPRPAGPAPVLTASTEVVSQTISGILKRDTSMPAAITVKSSHAPERVAGTVFTKPLGSDG